MTKIRPYMKPPSSPLASHSLTSLTLSLITTMSLSWLSLFSFVVVGLWALGDLSTLSEAARAFFVFGDSLVDNGNNNYLATTARADSPPYGIDSPTHRPSGRFSNGMNMPDIIS